MSALSWHQSLFALVDNPHSRFASEVWSSLWHTTAHFFPESCCRLLVCGQQLSLTKLHIFRWVAFFQWHVTTHLFAFKLLSTLFTLGDNSRPRFASQVWHSSCKIQQLIFFVWKLLSTLCELSNHPSLSSVSSGEWPLSVTYHSSSFYFQIAVAATTSGDFRYAIISHGMPLLISSFKLLFNLYLCLRTPLIHAPHLRYVQDPFLTIQRLIFFRKSSCCHLVRARWFTPCLHQLLCSGCFQVRSHSSWHVTPHPISCFRPVGYFSDYSTN